MKAKRLCVAIAALLAAGSLWLARSGWRKSNGNVAVKTPTEPSFARDGQGHPDAAAPMGMSQTRQNGRGNSGGRLKPGQMLNSPAPPVLNRRFTDFTPEQRVQFARQGHGPGG